MSDKRKQNIEKTLILYFNDNSYYFPYVKASNVDCKCVYRKSSKFISILRRVPILSFLSYGEWKRDLSKYKKVIVFDSAFDKNLGFFLKKNKINTYIYSWNTAISLEQKEFLSEINSIFPVYSFDKQNCIDLGLKYASMVYSSDVQNIITVTDEIKHDIFFMGWDKGRRYELEKLYMLFKGYSLNVKFILRSQKNEQSGVDFSISNKKIKYEDYLELVSNSKVLLDFQQEGQEGLTIRIVEALFLQKKIITNKQDIDNYDFYDPNNIFILGKDDINCLKTFVEKPYIKIDNRIIEKYDLKYWVDEYFKS